MENQVKNGFWFASNVVGGVEGDNIPTLPTPPPPRQAPPAPDSDSHATLHGRTYLFVERLKGKTDCEINPR